MGTFDIDRLAGALLLPLALAASGSDVVPETKAAREWIEDLKSPDGKVRRAAIDGLAALLEEGLAGLLVAVEDPEEDISAAAAKAIEDIVCRPGSSPSAPAIRALLTECEKSQRSAELAGRVFERLGREALAPLIMTLKDPEEEIRRRALVAMARVYFRLRWMDQGPLPPTPDETRLLVQALTEALRDPSAPIRWTSASILEEIGPAAAPACSELVRLIGGRRSEDFGPRLHAEKALVAIGRGAVPSLVTALSSEDPELQAAVMQILAQLGSEAGRAPVPALLKALKDPELRWHAALALAEMEQEPASGVPVLVEIIKSGSPDRERALVGLARYGPEARAALPALHAVFETAEGDLRRSAAVAMVKADPRSSEADTATDCLLKELNHQSAGSRKAAILALGKIGLDRSEILPSLQAKLGDHLPLDERRIAVKALGLACVRAKTAPHPERSTALEALIKLLRQDDLRLWIAAIEALGRVGPDAQSALPEIRRISDKLAAEEERLPKGLAVLGVMARREIRLALERIEASSEEEGGNPGQVDGRPDVEAAERSEDTMESAVRTFQGSPERFGFKKLRSNPQGFAEYRHLNTGMAFVLVPGGKILLEIETSSRKEQPGNRRPQREFTVGPFLMGKYEVTQTQWQAVMGKNPSWFQSPRMPAGLRVEELPVENVRFDSVLEFCEKTGLFLPTVAEWGFACRGAPAGTGENVDRTELGWFAENSGGSIHPVGKKKPNGFGFHDMYGNVWEYCGPIWRLNGFTYYGRPGPERLRQSSSRSWCPEIQGGSFRDPARYTGSPLHPDRPFPMTEEPRWFGGFRPAFPLQESNRTRPSRGWFEGEK